MGSAKYEPVLFQRFEMRATGNKCHLVARERKIRPDDATDAAGAKNRKFPFFPSL